MAVAGTRNVVDSTNLGGTAPHAVEKILIHCQESVRTSRKAPVTFAMPIRPSVRLPPCEGDSHWTDFRED